MKRKHNSASQEPTTEEPIGSRWASSQNLFGEDDASIVNAKGKLVPPTKRKRATKRKRDEVPGGGQKMTAKQAAQRLLKEPQTASVWTTAPIRGNGKTVRYAINMQEVARRIVANVPEQDRLAVLERYLRLLRPDGISTNGAWPRGKDCVENILDACGLVERQPHGLLAIWIFTERAVAA